jgi:hypothetical protein
MGCTACTEPQCLYKGALYLFYLYFRAEIVTIYAFSRRWNCRKSSDNILVIYKLFPWRNNTYWARVPSLSKLHGDTQVHTPHSVGLLWTNDQPDEKTSTWSYTTLTRDIHPFRQWDSNPKSKQASGRRPTPENARLLASAYIHNALSKSCRTKTASVIKIA